MVYSPLTLVLCKYRFTNNKCRFLPILFAVVVIIYISVLFLDNNQQSYDETDRLTLQNNYTDDTGDEFLNGPKISMDNPRLIGKIRRKFLMNPFPQSVPYKLNNDVAYNPSMGQAQKIMTILKGKKNGFFVECGAFDGETRSNTLEFERLYNWTGLLIEADPINFKNMVMKKRKAYMSPTCLSPEPYPVKVAFKQAFNVGKISRYPAGFNVKGHVDVQCFPLYSYLVALNRTTINYFRLDVEGSELDVLKTIPFEKLDIQTMSIEFLHVKNGKKALQNFVESQGYSLHSVVIHANNLANDFIFVKSSMF